MCYCTFCLPGIQSHSDFVIERDFKGKKLLFFVVVGLTNPFLPFFPGLKRGHRLGRGKLVVHEIFGNAQNL